MKKHLISLSDRQDAVFIQLAKELDISLSELIRRGLDVYIKILIEDKTLVRYTFTVGDKSTELEMPKEAFNTFYKYVKDHPELITIKEA